MNTIEQLEVSGSHREIGRNIGHHFAGAIHRFFDNYIFLQEQLLPFLKNSTGQHLFQSYLKIGSCAERRIVSVEVSPEGHHVHEVQGYYTHTNHYFELKGQQQHITLSSRKRLERSMTLCRKAFPANSGHVLALLGDQTDRDYPIYRDAKFPDDNATLCSGIFNLDNRQLRIYWDHPVEEPEKFIQFAL